MYNGVYDQNDRRVRRFSPVQMKAARFQAGDSVTYVGTREDFKDLRGKEGFVVARISGTDSGVTVEFDGDTYIMDAEVHLAKYIKREKPEPTEKGKGPAVEKRRGVSEGKGKKRRKGEEDE